MLPSSKPEGLFARLCTGPCEAQTQHLPSGKSLRVREEVRT